MDSIIIKVDFTYFLVYKLTFHLIYDILFVSSLNSQIYFVYIIFTIAHVP